MLLAAGLVAAAVVGAGVFWHSRNAIVTPPTPPQQQPPPPAPKAQLGIPGGGSGLNGLNLTSAAGILESIGGAAGKAVASTLAGGPQTQWTKDNAGAIGAGIGLGAFLAAYFSGASLFGPVGIAVATAVVVLTEITVGYASIVDSAETDKDNAKRAADVRASKDGNDYAGAWSKCEAWAKARKQVDAKGNVTRAAQQSYFNAVLPTVPLGTDPRFAFQWQDNHFSSYTPNAVNFAQSDGTKTQIDAGKLLDLAYDTRAGGTPDAYATGQLALSSAERATLTHLLGWSSQLKSFVPLDVMFDQAVVKKNRAAVAQCIGDAWAWTISQQVPWLTTIPKGQAADGAFPPGSVGGRGMWAGLPPYMRNVADPSWYSPTAAQTANHAQLAAAAKVEAATVRQSQAKTSTQGAGAGASATNVGVSASQTNQSSAIGQGQTSSNNNASTGTQGTRSVGKGAGSNNDY